MGENGEVLWLLILVAIVLAIAAIFVFIVVLAIKVLKALDSIIKRNERALEKDNTENQLN